MLVLGIDPGVTVGWALVESEEHTIVAAGQFYFPNMYKAGAPCMGTDPGAEFVRVFEDGCPDYVAIEDFIGSGPRTKAMTQTMNAVGYLVCLAHTYGVPVKLQVPQTRRPYLAEAEEILGAKKRGSKRHSVDAAGHALAYIYKGKSKRA